ncbi:MAG TPA: hypothetical protein VFN15_06160 [Solirubrobacterales bacterium]|nr:hypothetical protein [Solirubrobacterales bacterium]
MTDLSRKRIDELDSITGFFEGITFRRAGADLGVSAFGMSIQELEPGAEDYPEHDHSAEGAGGKMFAKRPGQLGQEEVYVVLRGSGTLIADGEPYELDPEHVVRVGPTVTRKIVPGPEGIRLLALGGVPGSPYDDGSGL